LVEILIVVALIAILSGAVLFGSGVLGGSRERAAATLVVSAVRLGLARANTTGRPARLVFDLDAEKLTLEETSSLVLTRDKSGDEEAQEEEEAKSDEARPDAVADLENEAKLDAEEVVDGPRAPPPTFAAVQQFAAEDDEPEGRALGSGVSFRFVQTEHDPAPRTEGKAYLYFWPGGETEHAVVHLGREGSNGFSILVSSLTGRAKIEKGEIALPEPRADGEISEREEE
jgi:general secretion pathway protein H